jgi:hypothetical protein
MRCRYYDRMVKEKAYQVDQNALAEYLLRRRTFV